MGPDYGAGRRYLAPLANPTANAAGFPFEPRQQRSIISLKNQRPFNLENLL